MIPTAGLTESTSVKILGETARFCLRFRAEDEGGVTVDSAWGSYQRKEKISKLNHV